MLNRCDNPRNKDYPRYGARGIKVCDRWQKFENFFADMGERPQGMSIDRYPNNNGNYEPGNCRWATPRQQSGNKRNSVYVILNGAKICAAEAARRLGRTRTNLAKVAKRHGSYQAAIDHLSEV